MSFDPMSNSSAGRGVGPSSPRNYSFLALFIAGAIGGVAGVTVVRHVAPDWLTPQSARASSVAPAVTVATSQPRVVPASQPLAAAPIKAKASPATAPSASKSKPATPPSADDLTKRKQLRAILQLCRSQIELYRLQHADKAPEFTKYPAWAQLTGRTRADGTPDLKGPCGPYLSVAPVNPLNGFGGLGVVRAEPAFGHPTRGEKLAFVYVSSTGKLFATERDGKTVWDDAAPDSPEAAHPRPAAAELSPAGKAAALREELQSLRAQLELYKLQHGDRAPDFARYPDWEQLRRRTKLDGTPDAQGVAPVLTRAPLNAINGFSKVEPISKLTPATRAKGEKIGFVYETSSGRLFATDAAGAVWKE